MYIYIRIYIYIYIYIHIYMYICMTEFAKTFLSGTFYIVCFFRTQLTDISFNISFLSMSRLLEHLVRNSS